MAETIESLSERRNWNVKNSVATYSPGCGGWTAKVSLAPQGKYYARWHIAIIDPGGAARHVSFAIPVRRGCPGGGGQRPGPERHRRRGLIMALDHRTAD